MLYVKFGFDSEKVNWLVTNRELVDKITHVWRVSPRAKIAILGPPGVGKSTGKCCNLQVSLNSDIIP